MTEKMPETRQAETAPQPETLLRRGLLYMLLGATAYYFASGSSGFALPVEVPALVTQVWSPLLFLSGLGFTVLIYFRPASSAIKAQASA